METHPQPLGSGKYEPPECVMSDDALFALPLIAPIFIVLWGIWLDWTQ